MDRRSMSFGRGSNGSSLGVKKARAAAFWLATHMSIELGASKEFYGAGNYSSPASPRNGGVK